MEKEYWTAEGVMALLIAIERAAERAAEKGVP